jgi:hypothetical protein
VIPLLTLLCPDILGDVFRGDYEAAPNGEGVPQSIGENSQRGDRLAKLKAHTEEEAAVFVLKAEVVRDLLVSVWCVFQELTFSRC